VRPVAAWVAAAVASVAVASWGVALVGRSVTDDAPAPLSAAEVEERLAAATSSTTTVATTSPSATPSVPGADTSVPPTVPGPTVVTDPAQPTTAPVATTAPAATAPPPPPTTTAPPPPAAGETRTYQLVGGTVSLRFEPTGVTVVFANPNQGFEVEQEPEGNGVRVELEGEDHRSRVTGWWDGGPRDVVDERAEGDGGGD